MSDLPEAAVKAAIAAYADALYARPTPTHLSDAALMRIVLKAAVPLLHSEGTATEWGVRRRGEADAFVSGAEGGVRKMAAAGGHLGDPLDVVCRQVTPWTLAPGEEGSK